MSYRAKERLIFALLVVMVLWLPVHRWLVVRFETNPWKLAGWAMYVQPQPQVHLELFDAGGPELRRLPIDQTAAPFVGAVGKFLPRRQHAGLLVRPDGLAEVVFEVQPEVEHLAIVVTHTVLDPATARTVPKRFGYRYSRPSAPASEPIG